MEISEIQPRPVTREKDGMSEEQIIQKAIDNLSGRIATLQSARAELEKRQRHIKFMEQDLTLDEEAHLRTLSG
jgi:hypothetical protein